MPRRPRFTETEIVSMRASSLAGHNAWDNNPDLTTVKSKIKNFGLIRSYSRCCYCGRNIHGEFGMVIDIEHILPKSIFPKYMFRVKNLSSACKRCNMNIKKAKVDFLEDGFPNRKRKVFRSRYYKIIHPNLDDYDNHLLLLSSQVGRKAMVKYKVVNGSSKGDYTYNYFKLDRLEKNSFDLCQGGEGRPEIENPEIRELFDALSP